MLTDVEKEKVLEVMGRLDRADAQFLAGIFLRYALALEVNDLERRKLRRKIARLRRLARAACPN